MTIPAASTVAISWRTSSSVCASLSSDRHSRRNSCLDDFLHSFASLVIEAIGNDVSRRYFPTIGLGELVRNPFSRWVRGHSQPQDLAAIVLQNQQPVEQSE